MMVDPTARAATSSPWRTISEPDDASVDAAVLCIELWVRSIPIVWTNGRGTLSASEPVDLADFCELLVPLLVWRVPVLVSYGLAPSHGRAVVSFINALGKA